MHTVSIALCVLMGERREELVQFTQRGHETGDENGRQVPREMGDKCLERWGEGHKCLERWGTSA